MRVNAQRQQKSGSSYARRGEGRLSSRPFLMGCALSKRSLLAGRPPRSSRNELRVELLLRQRTRRSSRQNAITGCQVPKAAPRQEMQVGDTQMAQAFIAAVKDTERCRRLYRKQTGS
jgi:hypothetical protein